MTILQTIPLSGDAIKVRWKEPYVTAALNQKSLAQFPKGVSTGFNVTPTGPLSVGVLVALDTAGLSLANVRETTGGMFSVTLMLNTSLTIDLTPQAGTTCFIVLDAQYVVGTTSAAQVKVVDALTDADWVLLAKVNVPGVGNVTAANINLAYRDSSGDGETAEMRPRFNLINNGTFEATSVGWTNSGFDSAAASTDFAHTGTYSFKLVKGVAAVVSTNTGFMPAAPGQSYRAGAWMHSPAGLTGGNGGKLQIGWYDAAGVQIGAWVDIETAIGLATAGFVERKAEVIAPALTRTAVARVLFDNCSGTLYVDDVQFASHQHDEVMKSAVFGGPTSAADLYHTHSGVGLAYGGGAAWADGTPNPATTVEAQLDKILTDLAGASGAPKIGNAPSKILTNTFTMLNTFNVGIGVGTSGQWSVVSPGSGEIDLYNAAYFVGTAGQIPFRFRLDTAGDCAQLFTNDGVSDGFVGINQGGVVVSAYAGMGLGTANAQPVSLVTNDVLRWQVLATGELQAQGGNRAVQNVLDPVTAQDAATKAYVDANAGTALNTVINGGVEIWQRGTLVTSAISVGSSVLGYNFHGYCADRFYAQTRDDFGGQPIAIDIRPFTVTGLSDTRRAVRIRNLTAGTSGQFYQVVQELDRDTVVRLRGKKVSWRIAVRKGTSSPANADFFCELYSNTGAASQRLAAYTGGAGVGSSASGGGALSSVNFTYFTGTSAAVIPAAANGMSILFGVYHNGGGPADANDYLEFGEVSIVSGDAPPSKFSWAGGDLNTELNMCERYYEKSYSFLIAPGTGGATTSYEKAENNNLAAQLLPGIRYKTRKRATPTITFYAPIGGSAGNWDETLSPGAFPVTANAIGDTGLYVTQGSIGVGGNWLGHWVADAEI